MQHAWGELWLGIGLAVIGAATAFVFWEPWFAEDPRYPYVGPETAVRRWTMIVFGVLLALIGITLVVRAIISAL